MPSWWIQAGGNPATPDWRSINNAQFNMAAGWTRSVKIWVATQVNLPSPPFDGQTTWTFVANWVTPTFAPTITGYGPDIIGIGGPKRAFVNWNGQLGDTGWSVWVNFWRMDDNSLVTSLSVPHQNGFAQSDAVYESFHTARVDIWYVNSRGEFGPGATTGNFGMFA